MVRGFDSLLEAMRAEEVYGFRAAWAIDAENSQYETPEERAGVVASRAWQAFLLRNERLFVRTGLLESMA